MGSDKALVLLRGRPLLQHAIDRVADLGLPVVIAGARSELSGYAPVIPDHQAERGPLGGICSALYQAQGNLALFLAVDSPLLPASLLRYLIRHAELSGRPATIATVNGFPQTFPAVIRRDALAIFEAEMGAGRAGCLAAFRVAGLDALPVELLVQAGQVYDEQALPAYRWFTNANTPGELKRLEGLSRNLKPEHG